MVSEKVPRQDRPDEAKVKEREKEKEKAEEDESSSDQGKEKAEEKEEEKAAAHMVSEEGYEEGLAMKENGVKTHEGYWADDQNWNEGYWVFEDSVLS